MQRAGNLLKLKILRPLTVPRDTCRVVVSKPIRCDPICLPQEVAKREEELIPYSRYCQTYKIRNYISAAFRSSVKNEAYLFMRNEYLVLNYAPGTQQVLYGPKLVCKGSPSLADIGFCIEGIQCAFGSHYGNEAFIFSGNCCAHIDYGTTDLKVLTDTTIDRMFPFLRRTPFEGGLDAAFESSTTDEAYLFQGNKYARINYRDGALISIGPIFACLKNTDFEDKIDAAFASHRTNEAYLFKKDSYARINFVDDCIIGGIKKILPHEWPALNGILPRTKCAYDHDREDHGDFTDGDYDEEQA